MNRTTTKLKKSPNHQKGFNKMNKQMKRRIVILQLVSLFACYLSLLTPVFAQNMTHPDSNPQTNWDIRKTYFLRFPAAAQHGPRVNDNPEGHDVIREKRSEGPGAIVHSTSGPVFSWPVTIPTAVSAVPTRRDEAIMMNLFDTFGYPVSDTQFQVIERYNHNRFLEQLFDPEKIMWLATSIGSIMANSAGNSTANMSVNQNITAIEYNMRPLYNFTIDDGNIWNRLRNELFVPMAILLLLPGAVLAQVQAIVAQGSPAIIGERNPFEGIIRSIVAIFLIPGSYLVVNYGIDVSNSIKFTIATEFQRITNEDMYELAKCSIKRAYPINDPRSNRNAIEHSETPTIITEDYVSPYESLTLNLRIFDPCLNVDESRTPDEDVRQAKPVNRFLVNSFGASQGLTWNLMCAFQVIFLYYLWCMGPIAAAISVWPIGQLRDAFKNWAEGVLVVCFWTLFWSTIILLMAAFKGVGDSGTIYVTALEMMAIAAVKSAFDFAGLVKGAGDMAMSKAAQAAAGGGQGPVAAQANDIRSGGAQRHAANLASGRTGTPGAYGSSGGGANNATNSPTSPNANTSGNTSPQGSMVVAPSPNANVTSANSSSAVTGTGTAGSGSMTGSGGNQSNMQANEGPLGSDNASSATGGAVQDQTPPPSASEDGAKGANQSGKEGGADAQNMVAAMNMSGSDKKGDGTGTTGGDANLSLSQQATINKFGRGQDGNAANDLTLNKDGEGPPLTGLAATAAGIIDSGVHNSINAAKTDQILNEAIGSGKGINEITSDARVPTNPLGEVGQMGSDALPKDAGPLTDMINSNTGNDLNREAMANGIDPDFAGNKQAMLSRSAAQDLMNIDVDPNQEGIQPLVSQDMLKDALNGDVEANQAIHDKLGVSADVLNNALHGDSGSASLLLAAAGHTANGDPNSMLHKAAAGGNFAAIESFKAASATEGNKDMIMDAALGDPHAAAQALQHNGADTQAWMTAKHQTNSELSGAGIPLDQWNLARQGGSPEAIAAQQDISRKMGMGDNGFESIQNASRGDTQDAAVMLAARGAQEMQNMSPEQIQQAVQNGDASIIAAQGSNPELLQQAIGGDEAAKQQLQRDMAQNPNMLVAANNNSAEAMQAIQASTGERPDVVAANAANTYGMLSVVADPAQVQEMMNAPQGQRNEFLNGVADKMNLDRNVLQQAAGGDSAAATTFMLAASSLPAVAQAAQGNNPLAQAAMVARQGVNPDTLQAATQGNYSAGFNLQHAVSANPDLQRIAEANPQAGALIHGTQAVTDGFGSKLSVEANPQGMVYAASNVMQSNLETLGVNPVAIAQGDQGAYQHMYRTLNVDPNSREAHSIANTVRSGLNGNGAAASAFGAFMGRTPVVRNLAREQGNPVAKAAFAASQAAPQHMIDAAVLQSNTGAQAHVQNEVAYDSRMMTLAGDENAHAQHYIQSSQGAHAVSSINSATTTHQAMGYFADANTVQSAVYGEGAQRAAALQQISRNMGVQPQQLQRAMEGQAGPQFFKQIGETPVIRKAASEGSDSFAAGLVATQYGQHTAVSQMAEAGNLDAQNAVTRTVAHNPNLQQLAQQYPIVRNIMAVASSYATPQMIASTKESISRNAILPPSPRVQNMGQSQPANYAQSTPTQSYASQQYRGSWNDFEASSSYRSSTYAPQTSYSSSAPSQPTASPYVTYGSDGRQIVVDPNTGSVQQANASHSHLAGYRQDSGSRNQQAADHKYNVSQGANQYRDSGPTGGTTSHRVDPGRASQNQYTQHTDQHKYNATGSEPGSPDQSGGAPGQVDNSGFSQPQSYSRTSVPESDSGYQANAPQPTGGFSEQHKHQIQPPEADVDYRYGTTDQARTAYQAEQAGQAEDVASDLRSEGDQGMLATGHSTYALGRDSAQEHQPEAADSLDENEYVTSLEPQQSNVPQLGAQSPDSDSGSESSLKRTLKDALPGSQKQEAPPTESDATRSEQERLRLNQEKEEADRRAQEEERLKKRKKTDFKRFRDKVQNELDEMINDEEDDEI